MPSYFIDAQFKWFGNACHSDSDPQNCIQGRKPLHEVFMQ